MKKHNSEVGYGKPPKSHQFKKGQSGFPQGRRKGSKNFVTLVNAELDTKVTMFVRGRQRRITKREAAAKQLANAAAQGDAKALKMIIERFTPPETQNQDHAESFRAFAELLDEVARIKQAGLWPPKKDEKKT